LMKSIVLKKGYCWKIDHYGYLKKIDR